MVSDPWVLKKVLEFDRKTNPATTDEPGIITIGNGLYLDSEGKLGVTPFYGFQIDYSVSDPAGCITYTGGAAGMSQAERKAWAYGKVTPTVVKDGRVVYQLKRDNLALQADGQTASKLDGTDGDVCASISPLWFRVTKAGKVVSVNISEYPQPGYVSAHTFAGQVREYLHLGMFEATGDTCNSVYSTTLTPAVSRTLATFRTQAQTKNTGLAEAYYSPMTYLSWTLYQILYVFAYGTLDSQGAVGNGNVGTNAAIPVAIEALLTANGEYGTTEASNTSVMALYVVNPWGNVWKFADGCMWKGGQFACLQDQADLFDIEEGWANKPGTWHTFTTGITGASGNFITEHSGDALCPFVPSALAGTGHSSATFACDKAWYDSGEHVCYVGGGWYNGAHAGAFCFHAGDALAVSSSGIGGRLQALSPPKSATASA